MTKKLSNKQVVKINEDLLSALKISLAEINRLKCAIANKQGSYVASSFYKYGREAKDIIESIEAIS